MERFNQTQRDTQEAEQIAETFFSAAEGTVGISYLLLVVGELIDKEPLIAGVFAGVGVVLIRTFEWAHNRYHTRREAQREPQESNSSSKILRIV